MKFSLLASGSKGNCCVIQTDYEQIVIDCGTTKRYLTARFEELGLSVQNSHALLITHEHIDHTSQMKLFKDVQIYTPEPRSDAHIQVIPYHPFTVGSLSITPIPTSHDADVSCGYIIDDSFEKLVYITDTGYVRERDKVLILDADYYIFESNHDPQMLMNTRRPYSVKQRILSDTGHLSNEDAAQILSEVVGNRTKEVVLAHLSQEANTIELARNTVQNMIQNKKIQIKVAQQFEIIKSGI
ncbi:MBL fold metallo-hydrolase [Erysipelothrix larvae]|uniref:MBL fold metallo-hydrolase n=1 Tax=Erysipelothrix larvae TaxID=1514105 RepID=A0A0X8H1Q4_9FIRM|nr:MBL fold metallo-hydrolase [Erysipelothrix larvae]AMC94463.1 MBL fold metallo-hydrolase [Erysipelothrix larvae]